MHGAVYTCARRQTTVRLIRISGDDAYFVFFAKAQVSIGRNVEISIPVRAKNGKFAVYEYFCIPIYAFKFEYYIIFSIFERYNKRFFILIIGA